MATDDRVLSPDCTLALSGAFARRTRSGRRLRGHDVPSPAAVVAAATLTPGDRPLGESLTVPDNPTGTSASAGFDLLSRHPKVQVRSDVGLDEAATSTTFG